MSINTIHTLVREYPEKVREALAAYEQTQAGKDRLSCSADIVKLLPKKFRESKQEHFLVICLDNRNNLLEVIEVHRGGVDEIRVDPRCVFRAALACSGCTRFIVAHNHPSGDPMPSEQDKTLSKRLVEGSKLLGLPIIDDIVLAENTYVSFCDFGLLVH